MVDLNSLQSKFMRNYESNPQYRMLSYESALTQMVQDGVLTKAEYDQLIKTSAFGFGFSSDLGDSVDFGGRTSVEYYQPSPSGGIETSKDKPVWTQFWQKALIDPATLPINYQVIPGEYTILTHDSYVAFSYFLDLFNTAESTYEQQRMNEGWVSDTINAWRELVGARSTRQEVSEELFETKRDIELLDAAMRGALVDGNGNNVDFETAFEATRGVKYSKDKIEDCQSKAEKYAQAKMLHTGMNALISNLEKYSYGSTKLDNVKEFNKNALKTFSMLGMSSQEQINEALAKVGEELGVEIKLVKQGTKGKEYYGQEFAIMFKNKDGKFLLLTPEMSRSISANLIEKIDATKKALLGLPLEADKEECEEHIERLKKEYEASFKEAYGGKDVSYLAEEYATIQQKRLMSVNLVANIGLIATSMFTGGATAAIMTGLLMTQPLQAIEMFTDENAETNLEAYGKMLLSQLPWMGAGMVMGKIGDLARSFVKLKGLQVIAAKTGQSLDDLVKFMSNAGKLEDDVVAVLKRTRVKADLLGISTEMLLDYTVTKLVYPEGATDQDWIMSFIGALAGSSLNKNISDFTKTKDVRAVELQKAFPDLRLSAEEAGKIISKIDEMVADGSWEKAAAKGAGDRVEVKTNTENIVPEIEYKQTFSELTNQLASEQKPYELYTDNSGNAVVILSKAGERPSPSTGVPFTFDVYRFDNAGNPTAEPLTGLSSKEANKYKLKNKQIVDNRSVDNSGALAMHLFPIANIVNKLLGKDNKTNESTHKTIFTGSRTDEFVRSQNNDAVTSEAIPNIAKSKDTVSEDVTPAKEIETTKPEMGVKAQQEAEPGILYKAKLQMAKYKLETLKRPNGKNALFSPEDIDKLAEYYVENPNAIDDIINYYDYKHFSGSDLAKLAILNVKTNGGIIELARMETVSSGNTVTKLHTPNSAYDIAQLSLETDGLAMEFARIPSVINKDGSWQHGGLSFENIKSLCALSEQYGKDTVLEYAKMRYVDSRYGGTHRTYWVGGIKALLKLGEQYGQDVIKELAGKIGEDPEYIAQYAKLNKHYNGLLLELISGDMEYKLHERHIINNREFADWERLVTLASRDETTKQAVKELMNYRDKFGSMKFSSDDIYNMIEKGWYPQYKDVLTELVNIGNEPTPRNAQPGFLATCDPAYILEAYAKHKDAVVELSKIKVEGRWGGENLGAKAIAVMAESYAKRPEDVKFIMENFLVYKTTNSLGEPVYARIETENSVLSVVTMITDWVKLNEDTDGLVARFYKDGTIQSVAKHYRAGFEALYQEPVLGKELLKEGINIKDINEDLVAVYRDNREDFVYLLSNGVTTDRITEYLSNNLYQNNRQLFADIIGADKGSGMANYVTEDVIKAYNKDSESLITMLQSKIAIGNATNLINKDFFMDNKVEIFEIIKNFTNEKHNGFGHHFLIKPSDIDQRMIELYKSSPDDFVAIVARLDADSSPSTNLKIFNSIIDSPIYQKNKTEFLLLIDARFRAEDITDELIQSCINNGLFMTKILKHPYYSCKASKYQELCEKMGVSFDEVTVRIKNQEKKMLNNPKLYVNGEYTSIQAMQSDIAHTITTNKPIIFLHLATIFDKEALDVLMRMRLDDVDEYLDVISTLSEKDMIMVRRLSEACNVDGKPFMPKQKVDFINLVKAFDDCKIDKAVIEEMLVPDSDGIVRVDIPKLNKTILEEIMRRCNMSREQIDAISAEVLMKWDMRNIHLLATEMNDPPTHLDAEIQKMFMQAANSDNFEAFIHDVNNEVGQVNAATRAKFEAKGADYGAWLHPDKGFEINFQTKNTGTDGLASVADAVVRYLTDPETGISSKIGKMFNKRFGQYIKDGKFSIPSEIVSNQEKLIAFIEQLLPAEEGEPPHILDDVWARAEANLSNPQRAANAENTLTIQFHLREELEKLKGLKSEDGGKVKAQKPLDLTVGMWDRDPRKDIFQGNFTTCCIGMNEVNGHAMFYYVMDIAFNFITVKDNTTGEVIGNALCYMAESPQGELSFIIDNIEIRNSAKPSEEACKQIRQQMTNYAARVAKSVTGKDDTPIYMSGSYNDVTVDDLVADNKPVSLLGNCNRRTIYLDLFGGWTNLTEIQKAKMYRLIPNE